MDTEAAYSQMATSILMEKRARRMAEDDALRLYNRVRQLQKEEEKAKKRIDDTKKKAKEIIKLRERNEILRQEKEQRLREVRRPSCCNEPRQPPGPSLSCNHSALALLSTHGWGSVLVAQSDPSGHDGVGQPSDSLPDSIQRALG